MGDDLGNDVVGFDDDAFGDWLSELGFNQDEGQVKKAALAAEAAAMMTLAPSKRTTTFDNGPLLADNAPTDGTPSSTSTLAFDALNSTSTLAFDALMNSLSGDWVVVDDNYFPDKKREGERWTLDGTAKIWSVAGDQESPMNGVKFAPKIADGQFVPNAWSLEADVVYNFEYFPHADTIEWWHNRPESKYFLFARVESAAAGGSAISSSATAEAEETDVLLFNVSDVLAPTRASMALPTTSAHSPTENPCEGSMNDCGPTVAAADAFGDDGAVAAADAFGDDGAVAAADAVGDDGAVAAADAVGDDGAVGAADAVGDDGAVGAADAVGDDGAVAAADAFGDDGAVGAAADADTGSLTKIIDSTGAVSFSTGDDDTNNEQGLQAVTTTLGEGADSTMIAAVGASGADAMVITTADGSARNAVVYFTITTSITGATTASFDDAAQLAFSIVLNACLDGFDAREGAITLAVSDLARLGRALLDVHGIRVVATIGVEEAGVETFTASISSASFTTNFGAGLLAAGVITDTNQILVTRSIPLRYEPLQTQVMPARDEAGIAISEETKIESAVGTSVRRGKYQLVSAFVGLMLVGLISIGLMFASVLLMWIRRARIRRAKPCHYRGDCDDIVGADDGGTREDGALARADGAPLVPGGLVQQT
jgi:hypothetical protein